MNAVLPPDRSPHPSRPEAPTLPAAGQDASRPEARTLAGRKPGCLRLKFLARPSIERPDTGAVA